MKTSISHTLKEQPPLEGKRHPKKQKYLHTRQPWSLYFLRAVLLVVAIAMLITGVCNGEVRIVFQKAVNICLECIGIG